MRLFFTKDIADIGLGPAALMIVSYTAISFASIFFLTLTGLSFASAILLTSAWMLISDFMAMKKKNKIISQINFHKQSVETAAHELVNTRIPNHSAQGTYNGIFDRKIDESFERKDGCRTRMPNHSAQDTYNGIFYRKIDEIIQRKVVCRTRTPNHSAQDTYNGILDRKSDEIFERKDGCRLVLFLSKLRLTLKNLQLSHMSAPSQ